MLTDAGSVMPPCRSHSAEPLTAALLRPRPGGRLFLLLGLLAALLFGGPVMAQTPASPPAQPTTAEAQAQKRPPGVPAGISVEQARQALEVLNDPKKRAAFAATLNALVKAQPQGAKAEPAPAPATTEAPASILPLNADSLGAQVLVTASDFFEQLGDQAAEALRTAQSVPLLWGWGVVMVTNPLAQALLADIAWRLLVVAVGAFAVEFLLRHLLRRWITRAEAPLISVDSTQTETDALEEPDTAEEDPQARAEAGDLEPPLRAHGRPSALALLRRVPRVLLRLLLQLIPILGMAVAAHLIVASSLGGQTSSKAVILKIVDAYAFCMTVLYVLRMVLSPRVPRLRLFNLSDETARYLVGWGERLVIIAACGYTVGEVGLLLGLATPSYGALQKTVGLILHVCVAVMVVQNRRKVRQWLLPAESSGKAGAPLRMAVARSWHWGALFVLAASWFISASDPRNGYGHILRYVFVTALVLIGARLISLVLQGSIDRALRVRQEAATTSSSAAAGISDRLRYYKPALLLLIRGMVYLLTLMCLLQIYGLGVLSWLVNAPLGQRILSAFATFAVIILAAFAVWEAVNGAIRNHLARLQRDAQIARSARLRTLLPLLRTSLLVAITVVTGLMILSQIGVNIAPLLAGAGIVGVAIGFGSQRLVQDLITGLFLLLENTMQVGDWVTVSGLSGTVEALSVRTIRLRAGDGAVHIIPFSAVTSVTNVNRGIGNASINVTVEFQEDIDRVADELKAVLATMRSDPDFAPKMLSDLQLWGVDKVDGAGVTLLGQVVCTDSGRWSVQREFNRRMKKRFQELGIRIYNPMRTLAVPSTGQGGALGLASPPPVANKEDAARGDAHAAG